MRRNYGVVISKTASVRTGSATIARTRNAPFLLWLGLVLLLFTGCKSTSTPETFPYASVIIAGNTPGQIREATLQVFSANGYTLAPTAGDQLVFEKVGSKLRNFAYGSWLGDDQIWVRVKTSITPVGQMSFRLACRAFMVKDRGGATEEESAIGTPHHGTYQKLLDEVAARFRVNWPGQ